MKVILRKRVTLQFTSPQNLQEYLRLCMADHLHCQLKPAKQYRSTIVAT